MCIVNLKMHNIKVVKTPLTAPIPSPSTPSLSLFTNKRRSLRLPQIDRGCSIPNRKKNISRVPFTCVPGDGDSLKFEYLPLSRYMIDYDILGTSSMIVLARSPNVLSTRNETSGGDQGGISIIVFVVVLLALFLATTLVVVIYEITKLKKRQKLMREVIRMQAIVGLNGHPPSSATLEESTRTQQEFYSRETLNERSDPFAQPPVSPIPPSISPIRSQSADEDNTTPSPRLTNFPDAYGDPYSHSSRSSRPNSGQRPNIATSVNSTSGRPSFSSMFTLRGFSSTSYLDEPAITDARSDVLARELSCSSASTRRSATRSNWKRFLS